MTGLKRDQIDKYYTKESVVSICMELFTFNVEIKESDFIVEPSAGNGAFINSIKELDTRYKFYDIAPEHPEIIQQDFLLSDNINGRIHVIGNPPFGRQSCMAIKFIKKAAEFADTISFILPKSFKKDSMRKHVPLNFHLEAEIDLPENSFLVNNVSHDVPCIFQIWVKKNSIRMINAKQDPIGFSFVKKTDNPNLAFRRVGVNAGSISQEIENKSEQSHYFLKITDLDTVIDQLKNINFTSNNTVGPKSISKQELTVLYNQVLG
jgi:hypothetical protein